MRVTWITLYIKIRELSVLRILDSSTCETRVERFQQAFEIIAITNTYWCFDLSTKHAQTLPCSRNVITIKRRSGGKHSTRGGEHPYLRKGASRIRVDIRRVSVNREHRYAADDKGIENSKHALLPGWPDQQPVADHCKRGRPHTGRANRLNLSRCLSAVFRASAGKPSFNDKPAKPPAHRLSPGHATPFFRSECSRATCP